MSGPLFALHLHFHGSPDPVFQQTVLERLEQIMASQQEQAQALREGTAVAEQSLEIATKVAGEITGLHTQIQALQEIINNMPNASPELVEAVTGITGKVQALRDALKGLDDQTADEPEASGG